MRVPTARRHHLVPRALLRRFADGDGMLRVVPRGGGASFVAHLNNVAVEKNFYAVETDDGWVDDVERGLAEIEGRAATAVDRLVQGEFPPRPDDRAALAFFIALQWQRGRDMRDGWAAAEEGMVRWFLRCIAHLPEHQQRVVFRNAMKRDPSAEDLARVRSLRDTSGIVFEMHQNHSVAGMLRVLPELADIALARSWVLVSSEEPAFLTSDSPVVLRKRGPGGVGFGTADHIRIALDRRHVLALVADEHRADRRALATPEFVAGQNWSTARAGYRHYFQHSVDAPLAHPLPPPRAPFAPPRARHQESP